MSHLCRRLYHSSVGCASSTRVVHGEPDDAMGLDLTVREPLVGVAEKKVGWAIAMGGGKEEGVPRGDDVGFVPSPANNSETGQ